MNTDLMFSSKSNEWETPQDLFNKLNNIPNPCSATAFRLPSGELKTEIPLTLLGLASLLPGYSPERATINTIELLQSLGIPTGTLPDGSPNLMLLYNLATNKANDKEQAENGKIEVVTAAGPGIGKSL